MNISDWMRPLIDIAAYVAIFGIAILIAAYATVGRKQQKIVPHRRT
jgi:hypothetical protein